MLIYDHALDPYHAAIRILAIATKAAEVGLKISIDAARIADYFLVYPYKISGFRLPLEYKYIRTEATSTINPYRRAHGTRASFERMRPIFFSALTGLVAARLVKQEDLDKGELSIINSEIPADLLAVVARFCDRQTSVGQFILADFLTIPIAGDAGLKARSGLMEYRYDIA